MDFTEAEVYDSLGVEPDPAPDPPQDEAETGQEKAAQPGEASQPPGETPADVKEGQEPDGPPPEQDGQQETQTPEPPPSQDSPPQENRAQDVERAVAQAVQAEQERQREWLKDFFKRAGLKNTVTGEDISTVEDFEAWERTYQADRLQKELAEGKLTPESLERVIADSPAVKRAEELARKAEQQEQEQRRAEFEAKVQGELAEIRQMDPDVKSLEDIVKGPGGEKFCGYVKNGLSYLDAFRLTNFERLQQRASDTAQKAAQQAAQAAREQARELARSKDHLTGAGVVQGKGRAAVPPAEMALFREMNPGASDSEIQSYYDKYERGSGK